MDINDLTSYLESYLQITEIKDYGPQGLQVEAFNPDVNRIALAVDSAPLAIEAAAEWEADMLLVHHGILWRDVEKIAGPLGERVRLLLSFNIHLYAAHLALDAHSEVGNNACLAKMLNLENIGWWCEVMGTQIGVFGDVQTTLDDLSQTLNTNLNTEAVVLDHGPRQVKKVAIVSGFGADRIEQAHALGADTFITGETSHANYWAAADYGMNVVYAGHYATETLGVKALGKHLKDKFSLSINFFDFPTNM